MFEFSPFLIMEITIIFSNNVISQELSKVQTNLHKRDKKSLGYFYIYEIDPDLLYYKILTTRDISETRNEIPSMKCATISNG